MGRFEVMFQYCDQYSHGRWNTQTCILSAYSSYDAERKCIDLYGLGKDCDYRIVSTKEIYKSF